MLKYSALLVLLFFFNFLYSLTFIVPAFTYSGATADIDLDGDQDIILGHAVGFNSGLMDTITVMVNQGNMIFEKYFIEDTLRNDAICAKDFNGDGYPDIISAANNGYIRKYINNQAGGFYERIIINEDIGATVLKATDVDSDGDMDIVYFNSNIHYGGYFGYLINDGEGNFPHCYQVEASHQDCYVSIGDIDNDGYVDASLGSQLYFYRGGEFENILLDPFSQGIYIGSTTLADIENDGDLDLFCAGYHCNLHLVVQEGDMNFENVEYFCSLPYASGWFSSRIFSEDLNNDGYKDLIYDEQLEAPNYNPYGYSIYVLINNEGSNFIPFRYFLDHISWCNPTSDKFLFSDIDNDGDKDIIYFAIFPGTDVCQDLIDYVIILFNDGEGNFTEEYVSAQGDKINYISKEISMNNYPNPFNPTTTISYFIPAKSNVEISIYNLKGQRIRKLLTQNVKSVSHSVVWNGNDDNGKTVGSGVYFYKLLVNGKTKAVKKCVMLK